MKIWKIMVGVAAGILAAAGIIFVIVRHLKQLRQLAEEACELCSEIEDEVADACSCGCEEAEADPAEETPDEE